MIMLREELLGLSEMLRRTGTTITTGAGGQSAELVLGKR